MSSSATAAAADVAATSIGLEEVVVTAQRRTENLQDVPITIQAYSGEQLQRLNVVGMAELLKYTPNVTYSGNGAPGTGNIFMRGLSSGGSGNQSQSTTAPFPNVALYLDDQSMQFPARNNDVYLVDMERVEILEGPQGTLFGGGAQAGAVRYITNKPKLDQTGGTANASYGLTAGGDPNSSVNATLNVPLIDGKLAFRAVFFNDSRGGYIDNVPGAMSVPVYQNPPSPYGVNPSAVNAGLAGTNTNTAAYQGGRLSALLKINDQWDALLQYNTQQFNAHGYWATEPLDPNGKALQPFETMAFAPAYEKDQYNSTALTINGDLGFLKAVYSGSYLDRHIDGQQDYSNYLRSPHGSYYACSGKGAGYAYFGSGTGANASTKDTSCYAPQGSWRDQVQNTHQSHEVRFTTPTDKRLRALVGAFYENFIIYDRMDFNYMVMPQCSPENLAISAAGGPDCISAQGPMPGYYANDPSLRVNTNTGFGEDIRRGYSQTAFFGSVDFDIIPDKLTITGGTRHYSYDEFEQGSEYYSASSSVLNVPNGQAQRGFGINLTKSESGFKSRGNLTWHVTPDVMVYYTYSEGFRPGGFNRTKTLLDGTIKEAGVARFVSGGPKQYLKPYGYDSDDLTNNEIGVKSEWLDHRLQLNATVYHMDWKNVQLPLFDPTHLGNTTFVVNGPTYRVEGLEVQFVARLTEGLTIQGSSSWNSTDQTNTPCLVSSGTDASAANPTPAGTCITQVNGAPYANPFGNKGDRAAYSPALQYNVRARYDWNVEGYKAFAGVGMSHTSWQSNEPANFPSGDNPAQVVNTTLLKYTIPDYTTYDAMVGVSKDAWTAQLAVINLTNNDAATSISSGQYIKQVVPLRPRLITFGIGYNF